MPPLSFENRLKEAMTNRNVSTFERQRAAMVQKQLIDRNIKDERVLSAMRDVPREVFVPRELQEQTYRNGALPIGHNQTISQPYTVAFMCEALQLQPTDNVLEVGTGSGYGAAVLSRLARTVHTVERIPELADQAQKRLRKLGYDNVNVYLADGTLGLADASPFNGIIVTAGGEHLPQGYVDQLVEGGRIVIPLGSSLENQTMFCFTKHGDDLSVNRLGGFMFVPLIGEHGWPATDSL